MIVLSLPSKMCGLLSVDEIYDDAVWCKGSTNDSGSFGLGSNPSTVAKVVS